MKRCIILIALFLAACGSQPASPTQDINAIYTAAAQTAWAPVTLTAAAMPIATETSTPIPPTATLPPTANPNLVETGTYIVGKDIQAGLYKGLTDNSCYWARLRDLSGTLHSILANDNSIGQYYIHVKATDYALQTNCELLLLTSLPQPAAQMPSKIEPGSYLVGIDIQPGTYQGQAGSDLCYWARLRDVDGTLDSIIANDNPTGQYYIQVSLSDFALSTGCEVGFVGK